MSTKNLQEEKENEKIEVEGAASNLPLNASVDANTIKDKLNQIENSYASQYPVFDENTIFEDLPYQEIKTPSSDEIKDIAEEELKPYKDVNIAEIEQDYKSDLDTLNLKEQTIKSDLENTKQDLANDLQTGLATSQANSIRNGVQNSSIATNEKNAVQNKIDSELQTALNKANTDLAEIALKRSISENEFQIALEKFDISYASKLEQKINDLNSLYAKKQAEAEEYNKKIAEQRKQLLENWRINREIITSKLDAEKGQEKAFYVIEQLKGLSKNDAMELLRDTDIIKALGNWYSPVVDYVQRILK